MRRLGDSLMNVSCRRKPDWWDSLLMDLAEDMRIKLRRLAWRMPFPLTLGLSSLLLFPPRSSNVGMVFLTGRVFLTGFCIKGMRTGDFWVLCCLDTGDFWTGLGAGPTGVVLPLVFPDGVCLLGCCDGDVSFFWLGWDGVDVLEDPDDGALFILAGGVALLLGNINSTISEIFPGRWRLLDLGWLRFRVFSGISCLVAPTVFLGVDLELCTGDSLGASGM